MRIKKWILLFIAVLILQLQLVFASATPAIGTFNESAVASGSGVKVDFIGRLENSSIVSVVIPTQVKFAVVPDASGWNKVLSPDLKIRNIGNVLVDVSITKAEVNTANVEFTSEAPQLNGNIRQVRLAVAPKDFYSMPVDVSSFLLTNNVNDTNSIILTDGLDYDTANNVATYNVYGDASSGWSEGEEFSVSAVFKVALN